MAHREPLDPERLHAAVLAFIHLASRWDHDCEENADPQLRSKDEKILKTVASLVLCHLDEVTRVGKKEQHIVHQRDIYQVQHIQPRVADVLRQLSGGILDEVEAKSEILAVLRSHRIDVQRDQLDRVKKSEDGQWLRVSAELVKIEKGAEQAAAVLLGALGLRSKNIAFKIKGLLKEYPFGAVEIEATTRGAGIGWFRLFTYVLECMGYSTEKIDQARDALIGPSYRRRMMEKIDPKLVRGAWKLGWTLDRHTISSQLVGYNEYGREEWDTVRTGLGELLFQLKYRSKDSAIAPIVDTIDGFLQGKPKLRQKIQMIVPMPPSNVSRDQQPVQVIGHGLSQRLQVPLEIDAVRKTKETPELKNITDYEEKVELLDDAFEVDASKTSGKKILLLDDLYKSGASADAVASALCHLGRAACVYFIALTRTRYSR